MGYKFQFITLAGFHALNHSMFDLATGYAAEGMTAYVNLQRREFTAANSGYGGVKHQRFAGTAYFDLVSEDHLRRTELYGSDEGIHRGSAIRREKRNHR